MMLIEVITRAHHYIDTRTYNLRRRVERYGHTDTQVRIDLTVLRFKSVSAHCTSYYNCDRQGNPEPQGAPPMAIDATCLMRVQYVRRIICPGSYIGHGRQRVVRRRDFSSSAG